jgi:hypothetical protein
MKLHHKYNYISEIIHNDKICVAVNYNYEPKYGKIDLNGNLIIPIIYDNMLNDNEHIGFHIVSIKNKWGIIDDKNEILVPLKYNIEFFYKPTYILLRIIKIKSFID